MILIVRSYAAKVPVSIRTGSWHITCTEAFCDVAQGRVEAGHGVAEGNPNGRWRPILLFLRLIGVMLHCVRFVQRRWRRFESRFFWAIPPREA